LSATISGTDIESDEALYNRIIAKVQHPATSGNIYHYEQWALEVNGIGGAKTQDTWNGNGTVRVIVIDSNKQVASSTLVNNVAAHIEENRPVGAIVTTISATAKTINIVVDVQKNSAFTNQQVTDSVTQQISAYIKSLPFKQDTTAQVSYARIGDAIFDSDVVSDYSNLMVNNGVANVSVADTEIAILGTVTVNVT